MTSTPTLETVSNTDDGTVERLISHLMDAHNSCHCCCQTPSALQEIDVADMDQIMIILCSSLGRKQIHVKGVWGSNYLVVHHPSFTIYYYNLITVSWVTVF